MTHAHVTTTAHVRTPLGRLVLVADGGALARICFPRDPDAPAATVPATRSISRSLPPARPSSSASGRPSAPSTPAPPPRMELSRATSACRAPPGP